MGRKCQLGRMIVAGLLALVLLLSGYESWSAAAGKVVLKFWDPDTREAWVQARNGVMKDFQASHPDISFDLTTTDWDQLLPKLQAVVAANTAPDLYYLDSPTPTYGAASQSLIEPMTDTIKRVGIENWPAGMIKAVTINGQIWGFPLYTYPNVVWYRKDLFQQAGLKPPTTLDDLLKAAETLNKPPRQYGIALYNDQDDPTIIAEICAAFGCSLFNDNGNITINSPQTVRALAFLKKLWQTGSPDGISKADLDARLVFVSGGAAIMMTTVSMSNELTKAGTKVSLAQVGAVPVPRSGNVPSNIALFATMVIPRGAPHAAEARQFLEFWATPDEIIKFGETTVIGHIPVLKSVYGTTSPYWKSPRIAPVAEFIRAGIQGAATNGFITGMYPKPNDCGPKVMAAGTYTQMTSHLVVDGWSPDKVASWAQDQIKSLCGK
jgi:multiple sugar transport system substrate-binding protein